MMPPFLSHEPKRGDQTRSWQNFASPKMRRFPEPSSLKYQQIVGGGADGVVLRARSGDRDVAVKIVRLDCVFSVFSLLG